MLVCDAETGLDNSKDSCGWDQPPARACTGSRLRHGGSPALFLLLAACLPPLEQPQLGALHHDFDGDGASEDAGDCDDGNPDIGPSIPDVAGDGIDQDCDGVDDCYSDADGDGHAGPTAAAGSDLDCTGLFTEHDDCDDEDPHTSPSADELVADGIDQDCDGGEACYVDEDGDGFGRPETQNIVGLDCSGESGLSATHDDCDDEDGERYPGSGCEIFGLVHATGSSYAQFVGPAAGGLGSSIAIADLDGDGSDEVLLAAPGASTVYGFSGHDTFYGEHAPGSETFSFVSADPDFGRSLAGIDDINGDGRAELLVGGPGGESYLFLGGPLDSLGDLDGAQLTLSTDAGRLGTRVADLAQIAGAGSQILGITQAAPDSVYLVDAALTGHLAVADVARTRIYSYEDDFDFGISLANVGDVNGDGEEDLMVGSPVDRGQETGSGFIALLVGPVPSGDLPVYTTSGWGNWVAWDLDDMERGRGSFAGIGDANNDGYWDFIAAQRSYHDKGAAEIFFGGASLDFIWSSVIGVSEGDGLGYAFASGDTDGDGEIEVFVSAPQCGADGFDPCGLGATYRIAWDMESGNLATVTASANMNGEEAGLGEALATGDVTGDGLDDLAVAEPRWGDGQGRVYLFFGAD